MSYLKIMRCFCSVLEQTRLKAFSITKEKLPIGKFQEKKEIFFFVALEKFMPMAVFLDKFHVHFTRSRGPGGQNVNKLNTKVDLRFHVDQAAWLPPSVRLKLIEQQKNRINQRGELFMSSDCFRTQEANLNDCLIRLCAMINQAGQIQKQASLLQKEKVHLL